jgi:hypothetical protein
MVWPFLETLAQHPRHSVGSVVHLLTLNPSLTVHSATNAPMNDVHELSFPIRGPEQVAQKKLCVLLQNPPGGKEGAPAV